MHSFIYKRAYQPICTNNMDKPQLSTVSHLTAVAPRSLQQSSPCLDQSAEGQLVRPFGTPTLILGSVRSSHMEITGKCIDLPLISIDHPFLSWNSSRFTCHMLTHWLLCDYYRGPVGRFRTSTAICQRFGPKDDHTAERLRWYPLHLLLPFTG